MCRKTPEPPWCYLAPTSPNFTLSGSPVSYVGYLTYAPLSFLAGLTFWFSVFGLLEFMPQITNKTSQQHTRHVFCENVRRESAGGLYMYYNFHYFVIHAISCVLYLLLRNDSSVARSLKPDANTGTRSPPPRGTRGTGGRGD